MASKKKITKKAPAKKPVKKAPAKKSAPKKATAAKTAKKTVVKKRVTAIKGRPSKKPVRLARRPVGKVKRARPVKAVAAPAPVPEVLDEGRKFANLIAAAVLEKKALDVVVLDVRRNAPSVGYDYIVIGTGDSQPQLTAMADVVREKTKPLGRRAHVEESPEWVLMNFDDVMVHLFTPEKRSLYDLDGLWSDVPRFEVRA